MRFFFTLTFCSLLFGTSLSAQKLDTLSIGAGYTQQAWYKFDTDIETKQSNLNWDLAFSTRIQRDAAIHTNPFSTLYKAVAPASAWATLVVDTATLVTQNGVDTSWSVGNFNLTGDNVFNYGWGNYSTITHHVNGDSIYVMKTVGGVWKKIIIDRLTYDTTYTFRYADLNGTNEKSGTLRKKDFVGKNFGYYSFSADAKVDREPLGKDWDITASRYYGLTPDQNGVLQSYPLTGILQNDGVKIAKVTKRDTISDSFADLNFQDKINIIGANWKSFDMTTNQWKLLDSTAYFIKTTNNKIYKVIFTKFGGSSTGNMIFTKEALSTSSVKDVINGTAALAVYPNPATDGNITLVYDLGKNIQRADFQLFNISGQSVFSQKLPLSEGLQQLNLPVLGLKEGIYLAHIRYNDKAITQKIVVR